MDIDRRVSTDGRARVILSMRNGLGRHRIARHHIITRLASRARGEGTEVVTGPEVVELDPAGAAVTADGRRHAADLVVASDGINSPFAQRTRLLARNVPQRYGAL